MSLRIDDTPLTASVRKRSVQSDPTYDLPNFPLDNHKNNSQAGARPKGRWSWSIVTILLLLASSTLLLARFQWHTTEILDKTLNEFSSEHDLDIVLHSSEHNAREPQTLIHDWRVTSGIRSPDGVKKLVYLINDEFQGPIIEARTGDELVVHVHNDLKKEGVAMHWHGLHMRNAIEYDGAVGLTQCAIQPGRSFTYRFNISDQQYGTYWYHAHDQVQRADGLFGGLIVHEPINRALQHHSVDEERLLMIGDWYHRTASEVLAWYMRAGSFGNEPVPDSIIINSKRRLQLFQSSSCSTS